MSFLSGKLALPYYAVQSGNLFRCVLADDPLAACVIAAARHLDDHSADDCRPDKQFVVAEFNTSEAEFEVIEADDVLQAGGYIVAD